METDDPVSVPDVPVSVPDISVPSVSAPIDPAEAIIEEEPPDIGGAVHSGVKWKVITQVVSECSRVLVALVLARLLTPSEYGLAGMAMVCVGFASQFTDPALGTALVQRRHITEDDRSTVFWTTLAVGLVATVICIAISGLVADLFGQPQVQQLFAVVSVSLVISGLSVTQLSLFTRALAYRSIEIREIVATVVAAGCALAVAFAGGGPWAIITNYLVFASASTLLVWLMSDWRPHFIFSRASLRDLGGFGLGIFGARIMSWGNSSMDNVLVGRYLGPGPLGSYALAYNIMYVPITRVSLPLASVFSPAYARMQHDPDRLRNAWLRSKTLISSLLAPAFAVTIVVAPDLVPVVFGSKWHAAIVPIQLLCLAGLAQTLVGLHWSVLTALKKPGTLLKVNVIVTVVTIAAFIAGLPFGIVGVAGFYALARWVLVPIDTYLTTRAVSYSFWSALKAGAEVLPLAVGAAAVGYGLRLLMVQASAPHLAQLVVVSAVILLAYAALLRLALPNVFAEIRGHLRRRRG
jgi:PST family polysaccharide transporter